MKSFLIAAAVLVFAAGCGADAGNPRVSAESVVSGTPQIDAMNCDTALEPSTTDCDSSHQLVMRCGKLGVGEAQPAEQCVRGPGARGMIWCCEPSFAQTCAGLCPTVAP